MGVGLSLGSFVCLGGECGVSVWLFVDVVFTWRIREWVCKRVWMGVGVWGCVGVCVCAGVCVYVCEGESVCVCVRGRVWVSMCG